MEAPASPSKTCRTLVTRPLSIQRLVYRRPCRIHLKSTWDSRSRSPSEYGPGRPSELAAVEGKALLILGLVEGINNTTSRNKQT